VIDEQLRVYLAASYVRRAEARKIKEQLERMAEVRIVSDWMVRDPEPSDQCAPKDYQQLHDQAQVLVVLTGDTLSKGGRHTELGIALAEGKPVLLLGPRERNVFHHLAQVTQCDTVEDVASKLIMMANDCPQVVVAS